MRNVVRCSLVVFGLSLASSLLADPGPMSISFTVPGVPGLDGPNNAPGVDKSWWTTALPVGNGKLAAMVFGGVGYELIQFNEDTIWTGQPHDYSNPNATLAHLAAIQTKCFNGQDITGAGDAGGYLIATPSRLPEYQCPGALMLTFLHSGTANYLRSLDLSNATVNVHYDYSGVTYNRDIFASAPSNRVIVVHFTTPNNSPTITFSCTLTNHQSGSLYTTGNDLVMHARISTRGDDRYFTTPALGLTNGVQYDARVRMVATGGTVTVGAGSLSVTNATDVTLYLSVASNVKAYDDLTADYVTTCSNNVANAAVLGYPAVRQAQQQDYTNLFNRVVLDLGVNSTRTSYDMGYRKKLMASDPNDPNLVALFFQLGRYLMISGSRPGSQALTLQGKWNDMTNMYSLWGSKMTLNINEEMNYWGAEAANLSECTEPLYGLIKDLSVSGRKVAQASYFCTNTDPTLTNAWVAHHNTDLWRNAAPVNGWDGYWPSGGAWLCQHLWWHYQYTGDTAWLRTNAYPLMKGAAQFFQGFLRTIPTDSIYYSTSTSNWMVTCPSMSPEHSDPGGHANYPGPTMDNDIIRQLFKNVIAASEILNTDAVFRVSISNLQTRLPPDRTNSAGGLSEFLGYDDGTYDPGHRHCSGLVGIFPGEEISPFYTPVLAKAAKVTVETKGDPTTDTPWSRAWRLNLHTRLQDGERAFLALTNILGGSKVSTNLVFGDGSDGSNRQLDFIFGSLSGVAEMFVQSQSGEMFLLPALPSRFTNGMVSGLCARGGFEVDNLCWTNGKLTGATILSKLGNPCRLRPKIPINVMVGTNYMTNAPMVLPGLYEFPTIAGSNYTIVPAIAYETENLSATFSDTHQVTTNAAFSNLRGTLLTANAASDYVTYTVPNVNAGTYHVYIGADAGANRGKFQLAVGPSGGTLTNVGSVQDTYSATNMMYLLPNPLIASTDPNYITLWTNMLKELDYGTNVVVVTSPGNYDFKFTMAGSSNYNLAFDYIKLTPAATASGNSAPAVPVNVSPANGAANQSPTLALQASGFSDSDSGDTHAASEWLVWRGSTNVFDSGTDSVNKTNLVVPAGKLDYGTTYNWQVRYQDNHSLWGGYSTQTMFSTVVPTLGTLGALGLNGNLAFAWPTNTAGFSLECVTNLMSTNWVPVTPPPVVVGGAYVVTNTASGGMMFYRLHKP